MLPLRSAFAQPGGTLSRSAQYYLLIDDSGSMRPIGRDPGADPDRLAVFAARSMLALLDDSDEVSVARLNGVLDGQTPDSARPLREVRSAIEASLGNDAPLARYAGRWTPCSRAFEAVLTRMAQSRRAGVRQVLVYLTDGACEIDGHPDAVDIDRLLQTAGGTSSDLLFYLLRFRGRTFTPALETLATRTGGATFELTSDATGILAPFAQALSQAQGFDAIEVSSTLPTLAAHTAARRVRLLAVAPGAGEPLAIQFRGPAPTLLGEPRAGTHRYEDRQTYRYVGLDYRPGTTGVELTVANAGPNWKLIAIPEYRLQLVTSVLSGACAAGGRAIQSTEVGATTCIQLQLQTEDGAAVDPRTFGGHVELSMAYQGPGDTAPRVLPLNAGAAGTIAGTLERAQLTAGDHVFRPRATVTIGTGTPFTLQGQAVTLQASTARMVSSLTRWEAGHFVPGEARYVDLTLSGNFARSNGSFRFSRRDGIPSCVRLSMNGVDEGGSLPLIDAQSYRLGIRVDTFCSFEAIQRELDSTIHIETANLPPLDIPFHATLDARLSLPATLELRLDRVRGGVLSLPISGNQRGELRLHAELAPPPSNWPSEHLTLGFAARESVGASPALAPRADLRVPGSNTPQLRARVEPCCVEGRYRTTVLLSSPEVPGETHRITVTVIVGPLDWWACHKGQVWMGVKALLTLYALFLLYRMRRNTFCIDRKLVRAPLVTWSEPARDVNKPNWRWPGFFPRTFHWLRYGALQAAFANERYFECWRVEAKFSHEQNTWAMTILRPQRADVKGSVKAFFGDNPGIYLVAHEKPRNGKYGQSRWYKNVANSGAKLTVGGRDFHGGQADIAEETGRKFAPLPASGSPLEADPTGGPSEVIRITFS